VGIFISPVVIDLSVLQLYLTTGATAAVSATAINAVATTATTATATATATASANTTATAITTTNTTAIAGTIAITPDAISNATTTTTPTATINTTNTATTATNTIATKQNNHNHHHNDHIEDQGHGLSHKEVRAAHHAEKVAERAALHALHPHGNHNHSHKHTAPTATPTPTAAMVLVKSGFTIEAVANVTVDLPSLRSAIVSFVVFSNKTNTNTNTDTDSNTNENSIQTKNQTLADAVAELRDITLASLPAYLQPECVFVVKMLPKEEDLEAFALQLFQDTMTVVPRNAIEQQMERWVISLLQ
jgi:hypothetical protein